MTGKKDQRKASYSLQAAKKMLSSSTEKKEKKKRKKSTKVIKEWVESLGWFGARGRRKGNRGE